MANSVQILDKIARNAAMVGLTVNSSNGTSVVIENGGNDLTITYEAATIEQPMGGVVPNAGTAFLGIGIANPGKIVVQGAAGAGFAATVDTAAVLKVLALCTAFGNDVIVKGSTGTELARLRGHSDLINVGM